MLFIKVGAGVGTLLLTEATLLTVYVLELSPQIAPIILALAVFVPATATAISTVIIARRLPGQVMKHVEESILPPIAAIKTEVTPNNGLTLGETMDKVYSRQIEEVALRDRTAQEDEHMAVMADNDPKVAVEQELAEAKKEGA